MTASEWQRRRSEFNHDWLGNQFLPALAKCHRVLLGEVEDIEFTIRFEQNVLPQWSAHVPDLVVLLDNYEISMSPRTLVEQSRIGGHGEVYAWVVKDVHSLWMVRYCVDKRLAEVRVRLGAADTSFAGLCEASLTNSTTPTSNLIKSLQGFRCSCMALSDSIHLLERDVQLV